MTNKKKLLALALRVEQEPPSRELDAAVFELTTGVSAFIDTVPFSKGNVPQKRMISSIPHFTSRVDDAQSLEPTDAQEICIRRYPVGVFVRITTRVGTPVYCETSQLTEAQARTSAALRAKAV